LRVIKTSPKAQKYDSVHYNFTDRRLNGRLYQATWSVGNVLIGHTVETEM